MDRFVVNNGSQGSSDVCILNIPILGIIDGEIYEGTITLEELKSLIEAIQKGKNIILKGDDGVMTYCYAIIENGIDQDNIQESIFSLFILFSANSAELAFKGNKYVAQVISYEWSFNFSDYKLNMSTNNVIEHNGGGYNGLPDWGFACVGFAEERRAA